MTNGVNAIPASSRITAKKKPSAGFTFVIRQSHTSFNGDLKAIFQFVNRH